MIKSRILRLLIILSIVTCAFMSLTAFGMTAKKETTKKWIGASEGGEITLENVTVYFAPGILNKDTKIHIMYFGDNEYQLGPEIKVSGTFLIYFADAPAGESVVMTFKDGEWVELKCINGYVETDHFSRYRGAW